jgi:hypothetical protein
MLFVKVEKNRLKKKRLISREKKKIDFKKKKNREKREIKKIRRELCSFYKITSFIA